MVSARISPDASGASHRTGRASGLAEQLAHAVSGVGNRPQAVLAGQARPGVGTLS